MPLLEEGQQIRDTYTVERYIGEGTFAEVYRVSHRFLGRQALKLLKQPGMSLDETKDMLKEALLLSRLGHANIVRVFDANTLHVGGAERGYFTMEHVPTGTLEDYRLRNSYGPRSAAGAVTLIVQVLQGLQVAHAQNPVIIHRDLKPQNILVANGSDGLTAKVSDFGLATEVDPLTLMSRPAGTPWFKAPEAIYEFGADSTVSDIWSVGTILYLLLTDEMPYPAQSGWGWNERKSQGLPRPASTLNIEVDEALDSIIAKCLRIEPHLRYGKVEDLLGDLRRWRPSRRPELARLPRNITEDKLGRYSPPAETETDAKGLLLMRDAEQLARERRMGDAIARAEEALSISPELSRTYSPRINLWRKGLSS
jgi:serine/threonine-protein kinase